MCIRDSSFTAGALGVFQAYSGASTYVISPESPADAAVGENFEMTFSVEDTKNLAQSWKVQGSVPGLTFTGANGEVLEGGNGDILNAQSGVLSGVPSEEGNFTFAIRPYHKRNLTGDTTETGSLLVTVNVAAPAFTLQPVSMATRTGGRAQFFATAVDTGATVQWSKNGQVLGGKAGGTLVIDNVGAGDVGEYAAVVNSVSSSPAQLTINDSGVNDLVNISTRGYLEAGDRSLIGGFVITGEVAKTVLVTAAGPILPSIDSGLTGKNLADPHMFLFEGLSFLNYNDNWGDGGQESVLNEVFVQVGSQNFESGSKDAAMLVTLNPGAYTVIVGGVGDTSGIALIEAYQVD